MAISDLTSSLTQTTLQSCSTLVPSLSCSTASPSSWQYTGSRSEACMRAWERVSSLYFFPHWVFHGRQIWFPLYFTGMMTSRLRREFTLFAWTYSVSYWVRFYVCTNWPPCNNQNTPGCHLHSRPPASHLCQWGPLPPHPPHCSSKIEREIEMSEIVAQGR